MKNEIKTGMLVRWKNWGVPNPDGDKIGLAIDVYPPERQPFVTSSVAVIWMGETVPGNVFLRFLEPFTDELNA